jgi:hypothetical protein
MNRCGDTDHRFAKFDDATIFCQRCGEQRVMDVQALIRALPPITYLPCPGPHYPPVAPWRPLPWTTPYWYNNTTSGTVSTGNTVTLDPNTNYTFTSKVIS